MLTAPLWTLVGATLGIAASVVAWRYIVWATEPTLTLDVIPPSEPRQRGENHPSGPHEFYHVLVRHRAARWPFASRNPAWATRATLEILSEDGSTSVGPIDARWPRQPEPVKDVFRDGTAENIFDPTLIAVGKSYDVHYHESRADRIWVNVAVKFEGDTGFFLFANESYLHNWRNAAWYLRGPSYLLRVQAFSETGVAERLFVLHNAGPGRDELSITVARP